MKKIEPVNLIFAFLGGIVLLFILGPLISMFIASSPHEILETTKDVEVQDSIWLTLFTSMGATVVFSIFAIPLSYLLARKNFPFKKLIIGIIDIPVVIPHSAAGIAILGFISRDTVIGKAASCLGLNLIGHPISISIAMAFVSIPFLLNSARDGFSSVPVRLEKAALNLGASPIRVFFTISLPLAWRNIISGLIMMFARGMSEFGAVIIVAYHPMITPVLIYERFGAFGLKYARPVSIVFIMVCLIFFVLLRLLSKEKKNA
ncbi:MAG: molybdenum ABC transporter permease [Bacteroidetes bacterium]|nr:MAG: molybdenum ABC transporter permease [Bacteroidota bacterium]